MRLFDYIFLRVYRFYQKRDGAPAVYASGVITVLQGFSLLGIVMFVTLFVDVPLPKNLKWLFLPVVLVLMAINWYRYERDFDIKELEAEWEGESPEQRRRNGWLIVVGLIFLILFPMVIGILRHNLEVIK